MNNKNIFDLLEEAKEELNNVDLFNNEISEQLVLLLRAKGIVPHKRITLSGGLHKLFAMVICLAYRNEVNIHVPTRRLGVYHSKGYTTKILEWLDECVDKGVLESDSPLCRAEGNLRLSELTNQIAHHYFGKFEYAEAS
tara:strand:+ start:1077 stop:1493 length:417 start_codon:yes stop_codon:yes gene_type:complete